MASSALPVLQHIWQQNRYTLSSTAASLIGKTDSLLAKKLSYDTKTSTYEFNKDAIKSDGADGDLPAMLQKNTVSATNTSAAKPYALDVPEDFSKGVTYHDTNSGLSFSLVPQFAALNAKTEQGHVVFPLDGDNQAIYTLKNNGLKEDIVVPKATKNSMTFSYKLNLPDTLAAEIIPNSGGNIGIYSADPSLFGDISYGSSKDQALVEKARKNGKKTFLVFGLPSPTITVPKGNSAGQASARFVLNGNSLNVVADNLSEITSTFSIDPSVVVTSTSDFQTNGTSEGLIDFTTSGQINRGGLGGGSVGAFVTGNSLAALTEHSYSLVYNGYMYVGGGTNRNTSNNYATMQYTLLNSSTGAYGTWGTTTALPYYSNSAGFVAYNGYMYILGGVSGNQAGAATSEVLYASINANGTLGTGTTATTWFDTTALPTVNKSFGYAAYNGYIYVLGGSINGSAATYKSDVTYAPINADGTIGAWTATTSLSYLRAYSNSFAYNGYIYIIGGANSSGFVSDTQYAPINADGTIGAWATTNTFANGRYGMTTDVYGGYLYLMGGWYGGTNFKNDVQYAQINANGTLGVWVTNANSFAQVETYGVGNLYNGYAYIGSGYDGTNDYQNMQYAKVDVAGIEQPFASSANALATTSRGLQTVAYNGYLYALGGDNGTTPTTTVSAAVINGDGTIGAFTTTGMTAFTTARTFFNAFAYNGYMYVLGGCTSAFTACTTATNDIATVYSAPIAASGGTIGTWTARTSFTTGRYASSVVANNGYAYIFGGTNGSTPLADVQYATLGASGAITAWTTATSFPLPVATTAMGAAVYGGNLYIAGGCTAGTVATCTTRSSAVYHAPLSNTGGISAAWSTAGADTAFTTARYGLSMSMSNGYLYISGGYDATTYYATTQFAPINANGTVGTWVAGPSFASAATGLASVAYNTRLYVVGGNNGSTYYATVRIATINNGGTGTAAAWASAGTGFTNTRTNTSALASNGFLYILGGINGSTYYNDIQYAAISPTGTIGAWATNPNSFTNARSNLSAVISSGYVYILGGTGGAATFYNDVQYALICTGANSGSGGCTATAGTVGTWATNPNSFTNARDGHTTVVNNGYMYVLGGVGSGATFYNDVQYALICTGANSGSGGCTATAGTVGTWATSPNTFTTARYGHASIVNNGYVYILGGSNSGGTQLNDVQYALICTGANSGSGGCTATAGTVGTWAITTSFTGARYLESAIAYDGYIYLIGGNIGGTTYYNDVQYAAINNNGTISNWLYTNTITNARGGQGYAAYNGALYILGGQGASLYNDVQYTALNVIDRVGNYSKLIDLGSVQTINSISYNGTLPNGIAAMTYYGYGGTGQLIASGVANSIISASNTACTTSLQSIRYIRMFITMDDSQGAAVFPDVSGANNAKVTDFTVNYTPGHPAPNIRLRTGQTLQAGVLSPLDTCIG